MAKRTVETRKASPEKVTPARPAADALYVRSIEKAFRVLTIFDSERQTLSLSQIAALTELDKSAAQRFAHTLEQLGYLRKDPETKRFELTVKTLDLGYHYTRANPLVDRAAPYLMHLSRETEETVSLSILDDTEIVYLSRFSSRHMLDTNVTIGSRLPAFATAPGTAILSRLPVEDMHSILRRSDIRPFTINTVLRMPDLLARIEESAARGYALTTEQLFPNDISVGAAIVGRNGQVMGAVSLAVSKLRYTVQDVTEKFAPLVIGAAHSLS